jgi:hypothetical protein
MILLSGPSGSVDNDVPDSDEKDRAAPNFPTYIKDIFLKSKHSISFYKLFIYKKFKVVQREVREARNGFKDRASHKQFLWGKMQAMTQKVHHKKIQHQLESVNI